MRTPETISNGKVSGISTITSPEPMQQQLCMSL